MKPILASALTVVKGKHSSLDVVRVETRSRIMYSFLSVGWGLISDIDIESERLRAIGGQRFTLWSVHRLISLRTYQGKVSYIPALVSHYNRSNSLPRDGVGGGGGGGGGFGIGGGVGQLKHSISYNTTLDCHDCSRGGDVQDGHNNCDACDTNFSDVLSLETGSNLETFRPRIDSWYSATSRKSTYFSTVDSLYESDRASNDGGTQMGGGGGDRIAQMYGPPSRLPAVTAPLTMENWKTISGDFVMVHAAYQTHLSTDCFFAPRSKLNDGVIWLVIIRGGVGRAQLLSFMLGLSSGTHIPNRENEYIQMIPVTAFRIEPSGTTGHMTVDGENVEYGPIQAEIFPSLAKVMVPK
ncbi:sphingosine kinase 2-like [Uranotaenia lowii]|uniref:sphingosine kinase 2-like n=1 Tax=Uranotaenia lowii TaxID=190385 RepID=UPI002479D925|nr:sphingosine kinase 2-like [Uranotaenia lowii]